MKTPLHPRLHPQLIARRILILSGLGPRGQVFVRGEEVTKGSEVEGPAVAFLLVILSEAGAPTDRSSSVG